MENLARLMQLVDANSDRLLEGDYLQLCDNLKVVHEVLKGEEESDNETENQIDDEQLKELETDLHYFVMHIEKLKKQLESIHTRKRLSPKLKTEAIKHFSCVMGLHSLREYTEEAILEHTNTTPKSIYEWYLKEHNRLQQYRRLSIESVIDECKYERDEIIAHLGIHGVGGNRE